MPDWLAEFLAALSRLPPVTQAILLIGSFGILLLVAINPPAGAAIIAFLVAIVALVQKRRRSK